MNKMKMIRLFILSALISVCFLPSLSQPNPFRDYQNSFVKEGSEYRHSENIIKQHSYLSTSINLTGSRPQIVSIIAPDTLMLPRSGAYSFSIQVTIADSDGIADVDSAWFYSRNSRNPNSPFYLGNLGNGIWSDTLQVDSQNRIDTYPFVFFAKDIEDNLSDSVVHNITLIAYVTSVESQLGSGLTSFELLQNYPNPFNPLTTISFNLPVKSFVLLKVYDLIGREIATLISEEMSAGMHSTQWTAANMQSGIYFYYLRAGSYNETKKLILLK